MRATPNDCIHLTVEIVREIHAEAIAWFGGVDGVRDRAPQQVDALCAPEPEGQHGPLSPALSPSEGERGNRRQVIGKPRFRGKALLESAVAAPQASFRGQSPYKDLAEVAAAYLFYLCRNHPFIDGNKRTALGACIVFLRLNGIEPSADGPEWEDLVFAVAASTIDRDEATQQLRKLLPKETFKKK